jgi:hypothetical protein
MLPLLFLLLSSVSAQGTLEDSAAAFATGDQKTRDEILKAGAGAILPLRKVRDRAPDAVDALLYDLKSASAGFPTKALVEMLDRKRSVDLGQTTFFVALFELSPGLPLIVDPALFRPFDDRAVSVNLKDRPGREILETICRQAGLDFGFFYGAVLIAAPERLWPVSPSLRTLPLGAQEAEAAERLMEHLSSDRVEERDEAHAALKKLGWGVIPLLEKGAKRLDGEGRARCQGLIKELTAPPAPAVFRQPGAARQTLKGADSDLRRTLEDSMVSFKAASVNLDGAMRLLFQPRKIPVLLAPAARGPLLTLEFQNQSSWAVLCVATQTCGFDFLIADGKLIIDEKEEIARRLSATK